MEAITVWLIEDDPTYRRTVTRALGRMPGIRCSAFPSFEDARTHLRRGELPEVVLLDVGLPGIDGLQALGELREHSPAPRVIVLTVFEDDDKIFDAVCRGASGYLLKSAKIDEIADAIRQAKDGGSPMTPSVARRVLDRFASLSTVTRPKPSYGLTEREEAILALMAEGLIKKEIAARLGISVNTVVTHLKSIYTKLHVTTNTGAVAKAVRERIV